MASGTGSFNDLIGSASAIPAVMGVFVTEQYKEVLGAEGTKTGKFEKGGHADRRANQLGKL